MHALYCTRSSFARPCHYPLRLGGGGICSCWPWLDDRDAAPPRMGPFGGLLTVRGVPVGSLTTHDVSAHALVIPLLTTRKATTNKPSLVSIFRYYRLKSLCCTRLLRFLCRRQERLDLVQRGV